MAEYGPSLVVPKRLDELCDRFGLQPQEVSNHIKDGESIRGVGQGGSESLVLILDSERLGEVVVRKVCGEDLSSVPWDDEGEGVMLPPSAKAHCQVDYLQGLPEPASQFFPEVYSSEQMTTRCPITGKPKKKLVYDLSYVPGDEVSTFIAENQPTPETVARVHHEILRCLKENIHSQGITERHEDTIEPSYLTKIEHRLDLARQATPRLFSALTNGDSISVNGQTLMNATPLLEFFRQPQVMEMLEPPHHSLVMGDTNTENVKITRPEALRAAMAEGDLSLTYEDMGLMFIDPRSIGFNSTGRHTRDDYMYDNKPFHNSLGNYDNIHGEHFSLNFANTPNGAKVDIHFDPNSPYSNPYESIEEHFEEIMGAWINDGELETDDPNWLARFAFIMGTHFAAMPPFHFKKSAEGVVAEDPERQKRAVAVYIEGIKWLNRAQQMISGKQQQLFGVQVAPESVVAN